MTTPAGWPVLTADPTFTLPPDAARNARLGSGLHAPYLIFDVDLAEDAIRLTRILERLLPGDARCSGCSPSCF